MTSDGGGSHMQQYDKSFYYIDFSGRDNLTEDEKKALEEIQNTYRPIERVDLLLEKPAWQAMSLMP